ncbi:MAG TPA: BlaI/MecI/CopY family transcriptional regulator [Allosphingosinicella sp.]|jgi:predicted transcriptional regulator
MAALSRRERELMQALYTLGEGSVEQVRQQLADPPAYDSVRTLLRILESKGHVRRRQEGRRYLYTPTQERAVALKNAWKNLVQTFFHGSHEQAAATLLDASDRDLDEQKLARLLDEVERSRMAKRD